MDQRKAVAIAAIAAATILLDSSSEDEDESPPKRHRVWVKNWVGRREQLGCYARLLTELRAGEPKLYRNFLRLTSQQFDDLLALVTPHIQKQNTNMRESISPGERLMLTLRYLATGNNFHDLQYIFRIPQSTISQIIPEVLDAIYKVLLGEFLQVQSIACIHYPHIYIIIFFSRRRHHLRLGKRLLINTMNCGNFQTASVRWMESMW